VQRRHDRRRRLTRAAAIALVVACAGGVFIGGAARVASADALVDGLATDDPRELAAAVDAIEHAVSPPPEALFAAARTCEDKLASPSHALAIYERIVRDMPDAGVAASATRRIDALRAMMGSDPTLGAQQADALAQLIAVADHMPPTEVMLGADAIAAAPWPGAPGAALWLGDWLRRTQRYADADARFATVIARWPGSPQARAAARGAAGIAIETHNWVRADELVVVLPADTADDRALRDDLARAIDRGRLRAHLYIAAWSIVALVVALLLASLAEAMWRGGLRKPALRPPLEIMFLAPIAAVIAGASFTAHQAIAPAVLWISITGIVLAWLSGTTLDVLRARGRSVRARAIAHVALCALGVLAIGYIAMTRDGLIDLLVETVRFGPE
jgi:hypothetical protein